MSERLATAKAQGKAEAYRAVAAEAKRLIELESNCNLPYDLAERIAEFCEEQARKAEQP